MMPLLDFANHHTICSNYYEYRACSFSDARGAAEGVTKNDPQFAADSVEQDELCCFWRAGEDIKEGQELCNRYGYMAPDQVGGGGGVGLGLGVGCGGGGRG
jgi:hypothetical protein